MGAAMIVESTRSDDRLSLSHHKGGEWLTSDVSADEVFTPERLSDEHRLDRADGRRVRREGSRAALAQLETKDWALARTLIARAGELGLLGADVPEAFGGVALDKAASIVVGEAIGVSASFATTFGAQTGLAIIPILCFGTDGAAAAVPAAHRERRDHRRVLPERVGVRIGRARRARAGDAAAGRILAAQRREDVDHQRRLRRHVHRLRQSRRRAVLRVHRRARLPGRRPRQGRTQDGPARIVDDADRAAGRGGAGGQSARRGRQGPQDRVQRAQLRPVQAGRHVHGRRQSVHRRGRRVRARRGGSSASRSRRSARFATSSRR